MPCSIDNFYCIIMPCLMLQVGTNRVFFHKLLTLVIGWEVLESSNVQMCVWLYLVWGPVRNSEPIPVELQSLARFAPTHYRICPAYKSRHSGSMNLSGICNRTFPTSFTSCQRSLGIACTTTIRRFVGKSCYS